MRKRYLIANWKMNLPPEGPGDFLKVVRDGASGSSTTLIVAPPFPFVGEIASGFRGFAMKAGAQTCSTEPHGALTGEVSASMLREVGAAYVLAGHSERRTLFGETDAIVAKKVAAISAAALIPVLCVGESAEVRDRGEMESFLHAQIKASARSAAGAAGIVLAYEPVWAIGTGRNASPGVIAETVALIRQSVSAEWEAGSGAGLSVLYGGSVTPENIAGLWETGAIDGFLVGGASLDSGRLLAILGAMEMSAVPSDWGS